MTLLLILVPILVALGLVVVQFKEERIRLTELIGLCHHDWHRAGSYTDGVGILYIRWDCRRCPKREWLSGFDPPSGPARRRRDLWEDYNDRLSARAR